jgi:hypothetical protein
MDGPFEYFEGFELVMMIDLSRTSVPLPLNGSEHRWPDDSMPTASVENEDCVEHSASR